MGTFKDLIESKYKIAVILFFIGFMLGAMFTIVFGPILFDSENTFGNNDDSINTKNPVYQLSRTDAYWKISARPFIITDDYQSKDTGKIILSVQNKDIITIALTEIIIKTKINDYKFLIPELQRQFVIGGKRTYSFQLDNNCTVGEKKQYEVEFSFEEEGGKIKRREIGEQPLRVLCK